MSELQALKDTPSSSKGIGKSDDMDIFVLQGAQIFLSTCVNYPAASEIPALSCGWARLRTRVISVCRRHSYLGICFIFIFIFYFFFTLSDQITLHVDKPSPSSFIM